MKFPETLRLNLMLDITLPETNIAIEKMPSYKASSLPLPMINFQVLC